MAATRPRLRLSETASEELDHVDEGFSSSTQICAINGGLRKEPERCKRRRAGTALVWNNRETEMSDLAEIEALFFVLVSEVEIVDPLVCALPPEGAVARLHDVLRHHRDCGRDRRAQEIPHRSIRRIGPHSLITRSALRKHTASRSTSLNGAVSMNRAASSLSSSG